MASFSYKPVTSQTLHDLRRFSGCHGKFSYCSCMRWRLKSTAFQRSSKEERIGTLESFVEQGKPVGILAYAGEDPIGWCSVAPRETYEGLERYKALPRIDDLPVWSVACFFVDAKYRRQGLNLGLLQASVAYAISQGSLVVEGYPVEPGAKLYTYMGRVSTFERAGFQEVTPAGRERRIFRFYALT